MSPEDFSQYDVVITTYQTLASDWASGGQPPKACIQSAGDVSSSMKDTTFATQAAKVPVLSPR